MSLLASQIVKIFEENLLSIRSSTEGDLYDKCGRNELINKVEAFIKGNQSIKLLLPGFPCKSPNLEKVCGKLSDAGQFNALECLNNICREISFLYESACELTIWSDGRVFEDLIGVSAQDIAQYECLLKYYSVGMRHIQWDSMNNYINQRNAEYLVEKYGRKTFSFDQWLIKSKKNKKQFIRLKELLKTI